MREPAHDVLATERRRSRMTRTTPPQRDGCDAGPIYRGMSMKVVAYSENAEDERIVRLSLMELGDKVVLSEVDDKGKMIGGRIILEIDASGINMSPGYHGSLPTEYDMKTVRVRHELHR